MRRRFVLASCAVSCTVLLSACETTGPKEGVGQAMGGVIGSVLGGTLVSSKHRGAGIAVGATAGVMIGKMVGQYLDEQDRLRMAEATRQAAVTGQTQDWSNPQNKTRGEVQVVSTQKKKEPVVVPVLKDKVKQVPPLDIIGDTYTAKGKSNLRGGPGTDYVVVGSMSAGEVVNVVGKVQGSNWYFVSQDGVGSGFAHVNLLTHAPGAELPAPDSTTAGRDDVAEQQVASERLCRTVKQTVSLPNGSTQSETVEVCQGADGWEAKA